MIRLAQRAILAAAAMLVSPTPLAAQSIAIQSAPPYGASGSISGTVTGVSFAAHRVAVYIHIDGVGWWTKPSAAAPTVPIQPDGSFTANVYSCCLDDRATILYAVLLPAGLTPPLANGGSGLPPIPQAVATARFDRAARTLAFAGRTWAVKESAAPVGPGGNRFTASPQDVFVDAHGRLHLRVVQRGGQWWSSEVVLQGDVGHGTYWFTTESQVGLLDPNLTFGAFTWDSFGDDATIPAWPHREIDFEDSRWGNGGDPNSSQVVVQPFTQPGNVVRYDTPPLGAAPTLTRFFHWAPDRIEFRVALGAHSPGTLAGATVLHASDYVHDPAVGHRVPPAGRQQFRFNFWINQGGAPLDGQTAEVVVSDFRYSPTVGAFPGGCGINPTGSAVVVSGAPRLGDTITLGFDNPLGTQTPGALAGLALGVAAARFPCGVLGFGFGMAGPAGEVLVDLAVPPIVQLGGVWAGAGNPAPFPLVVPPTSSLVGQCVVAQGFLLDAVGPVPIGVADALELCIRP
ncbi:MAG: hypothetical protein AB7O97_12705 [Planctomycetota bacterium]